MTVKQSKAGAKKRYRAKRPGTSPGGITIRTMKISSKGQVTLPREVRRVLGSDVVTFDVVDGRVLLRPVADVGGSLREYAGQGPAGKGFRTAREQAWEEVAREKTARSHP